MGNRYNCDHYETSMAKMVKKNVQYTNEKDTVQTNRSLYFTLISSNICA